jgi:hypothetical protein
VNGIAALKSKKEWIYIQIGEVPFYPGKEVEIQIIGKEKRVEEGENESYSLLLTPMPCDRNRQNSFYAKLRGICTRSLPRYCWRS